MALELAGGSVAHVIQLSVAPVFLLSGIGAMLGVMTNRLARVIDRARTLEERLHPLDAARPLSDLERILVTDELDVLRARARLTNRAVTLCTLTAILVCCVIVILFVDSFLPFHVSLPIALLFIAAMGCFIAGLVHFLREILLATARMRIGPPEGDA